MAEKTNYFVTMKDTFLSGWGESQGKDNILVFPCSTYEEAENVFNNSRARTDMTDQKIRITYPRYDERFYYVQRKTKEEAPRWYEKDYFKNSI